jgi:biotin transport system substrate-specific component
VSSNVVVARRPHVLADLLPGIWTRDIALVILGAGLTGALAQISIHIPGTPVPYTGQTLGVLLTGCSLGARRATASMTLYAVLGFIGLPWFAGGQGGYVGANAGYIFGFILAAFLCGLVADRGADRRIIGAIPAMLIGEIAIYLFGVPRLAVSLHVGLQKAIDLGFTPFYVGDAIKAAIGALLLPAAWQLAGRRDA